MKHDIPKTMSTQHPDNVHSPFFASDSVLEGEDEIKEAFYVYSHLGCKEQLWDCEGKEVDTFVVKKLLSRHEPFFSKNRLGKDFFLTLRVPNPEIDKDDAKILLETLESIPRSFDVARLFYRNDIAPIFEVALPMTTSVSSLIRIREFFRQLVVGKENTRLIDDDITIGDWIGSFNPKEIRVIPLLETKDSILNADKMVKDYIVKQKIQDYQRVWLARSDPALNYGSLSAILLCKLALQKLHELEENMSVDIFPIIGCGSAPFRGNLTPRNLNCLEEYPSVHTFTLQSAFKYDYDERDVRNAVEKMNQRDKGKPHFIDERAVGIIDKVSTAFHNQVKELAPLINSFSTHIPQRRKRMLHIGLYGYPRATEGVKLPRAIPFCATMYSLGLPPEILGLSSLNSSDLELIHEFYRNFEYDLGDALRFLNKDNLEFFPQSVIKEVNKDLELLGIDFDIDEEHREVSSMILQDYRKKNFATLEENIIGAASIRCFLG